jgi:hypothetical protein
LSFSCEFISLHYTIAWPILQLQFSYILVTATRGDSHNTATVTPRRLLALDDEGQVDGATDKTQPRPATQGDDVGQRERQGIGDDDPARQDGADVRVGQGGG